MKTFPFQMAASYDFSNFQPNVQARNKIQSCEQGLCIVRKAEGFKSEQRPTKNHSETIHWEKGKTD